MLSTGETYRDLGPDYFTNRDPERQTTRLVKQLETPRTPRHPPRGRGSLSELFLPGSCSSVRRRRRAFCAVQ